MKRVDADRLPVRWVTDTYSREALIAAHPEAALVAESLPLRANLSVMENIAIVPRYRQDLDEEAADAIALALLERVGFARCAHARDPDLDREERFVAKLLQAVLARAPLVLVDRPGLLLPDVAYPHFLDTTFTALGDELGPCWIIDYPWNAPLYGLSPSDICA
jgi:predicted ABC-type transport system involved in lysophospholipase L1 biosynthesis ATPase subunit